MNDRSTAPMRRCAAAVGAMLLVCCADAVDVTNIPDDATLTVRAACEDTITFKQTCTAIGHVQFETGDFARDVWTVDLMIDRGSFKKDTVTHSARLTTNSVGEVSATIYPPARPGDIVITIVGGGRRHADTLHVKDTTAKKPADSTAKSGST